MATNRTSPQLPTVRVTALAVLLVVTASCNSHKEVTFTGNSLNAKPAVTISDITFPAGVISSGTAHYKPQFGIVEDDLSLIEAPALSKTMNQVNRTQVTNSFNQGYPGKVDIENYSISGSAQLDLLVVVDNSSSMAGEEALLAVGMQNLVSSLTNINWQIGVITTDNPTNPNLINADGCELYGTNGKPGGQPILASDPQAAAKFLSTITNIGAQGSDSEQSLLNIYKHLTNTCAYGSNSWLRPNALLGIIVITDEDSFCPEPAGAVKDSDSLLCTLGQRPADLINLLTPPQRAVGTARMYSITWHNSDMSCYTNAQRPANRILQVVNGVGGFDNSICQSDYSSTLGAISADAAGLLTRTFTLPHPPISGSVVASIVGANGVSTPTTNFAVNGTTLTLNNVSTGQVTLHLSYLHDPAPIFNAVTLTQAADPASIQVSVNDNPLPANAFSYDPTTGIVALATTPDNYAAVAVTYRAAGVLPSSFDISSVSVDEPPTTLTVNGVATTDFVWDTAAGKLEFPTAPADASVISFSYVPAGAKTLTYPIASNSAGTAPISIKVTDATSGTVIPITESNDNLVFDETDVVNGRKVVVTYDYGDTTTVLSQLLANPPIDGSVTVKPDDGSTDCVKDVVVTGQKVTFNCDAAAIGEVAVSYQWVAAHYTSFTVDKDIPLNPAMQVLVDGNPITDYTVSGRTFTIPLTETKPSSSVHIVVIQRGG